MDNDNIRAAFDAWAFKTGYDAHQHSAATFDTAWRAWQAAWNRPSPDTQRVEAETTGQPWFTRTTPHGKTEIYGDGKVKSIEHEGFIAHFDNSLTAEEETQMKDYLSFVRSEQRKGRKAPSMPSAPDESLPTDEPKADTQGVDGYKVKTAYLLLDRIKDKSANVSHAMSCLEEALNTPEEAICPYLHPSDSFDVEALIDRIKAWNGENPDMLKSSAIELVCEYQGYAKQESATHPTDEAVHANMLVMADRALLLAARWFKLNFDDDTLHEHPPSKADLAGMFDAMQDARKALTIHEQRRKG